MEIEAYNWLKEIVDSLPSETFRKLKRVECFNQDNEIQVELIFESNEIDNDDILAEETSKNKVYHGRKLIKEYPEEVVNFVKANKDEPLSYLIAEIKRRFNIDYTTSQLKTLKTKYKIEGHGRGRFKKNDTPSKSNSSSKLSTVDKKILHGLGISKEEEVIN